VLFRSCKRKQWPPKLFGEYKSREIDFADRIILIAKNQGYIVGSTLILYPDSTYVYENCGNSLVGNWKKDNQFILLYCTDLSRRRDNQYVPCYSGADTFNTNAKGDVYRVVHLENSRSLEYLQRQR